MATPQFFPIPPELHALACETINRRIEQIPFVKNGITVTSALIGISMECLNAEATKTLPVRISSSDGTGTSDFAGCLGQRLESNGSALAPVIAHVLIEAELAESADVLDRTTHTNTRGIRLVAAFTWHSATPIPPTFISENQSTGNESTAAWLAKCPICKTGILQTIVGKRLYGIPPTDFYHDCTHCGAKFIPEKDQFRLVSIARIADPIWRQNLNKCRSPDDWMVMAQAAPAKRQSVSNPRTRSSIPLIKVPKRTAQPVAIEGPSVSFPGMKDGSITVPYAAKTLYFKPVPLQFVTGNKRDIFAKSMRVVADVLSTPAFSSLKSAIEKKYADNLRLPLGRFVAELRQRSDLLYRELLNRYGDEEYSTFRMQDESRGGQKGVVLVIVQGKLCHIAACHTSIASLIDDNLGRIMPDMCFSDGDATACRLNALLSTYRGTSVVYIHALSNDAEIDECAGMLKNRYLPVIPSPE